MNAIQPNLNVFTGSIVGGSPINVNALDRRSAVHKIVEIFRSRFPGTNAKGLLTIDDVLDEVIFHDDMRCNDTLYSYLPQHVAKKLVDSSKGVISIDPNYPNSRCQLVRLIKKKEKKKYASPVKHKRKITPINPALLVPKKKSVPRCVWLSSKILPDEIHPTPTVVEKECIPLTGRAVITHMHLTEVYR